MRRIRVLLSSTYCIIIQLYDNPVVFNKSTFGIYNTFNRLQNHGQALANMVLSKRVMISVVLVLRDVLML